MERRIYNPFSHLSFTFVCSLCVCVCCCSVPFLKGGAPPIRKQVLQSNTCRQQRYFGVLKLGVTVIQHNCVIRIAMTAFVLWCVLLQVFCVWLCVSGTAINSKIGSLTGVTNMWLATWPRTLQGIGETLFWRPDESPISLSLNLFECSFTMEGWAMHILDPVSPAP